MDVGEEAWTNWHHYWSSRCSGRERTRCVVPADALSYVDMAFIQCDEEVGYVAEFYGQLRRYEELSEAEMSTTFMRLVVFVTPLDSLLWFEVCRA